MDDLVETVARAIWETPLLDQPPGFEVRKWPPDFEFVRQEYLAKARAIIPIVLRDAAEVVDNYAAAVAAIHTSAPAFVRAAAGTIRARASEIEEQRG